MSAEYALKFDSIAFRIATKHGNHKNITDTITVYQKSNNNSNIGKYSCTKNICQIHQWAKSDRVKEFFKEKSEIDRVPCCYWVLFLLSL